MSEAFALLFDRSRPPYSRTRERLVRNAPGEEKHRTVHSCVTAKVPSGRYGSAESWFYARHEY